METGVVLVEDVALYLIGCRSIGSCGIDASPSISSSKVFGLISEPSWAFDTSGEGEECVSGSVEGLRAIFRISSILD